MDVMATINNLHSHFTIHTFSVFLLALLFNHRMNISEILTGPGPKGMPCNTNLFAFQYKSNH